MNNNKHPGDDGPSKKSSFDHTNTLKYDNEAGK